MADLRAIDAEPPAEDVIATLEHALDKARAGELSSVSVLYVYRDGCTGYSRSALPSYPAMMGSAARFLHKMNLDLDAG